MYAWHNSSLWGYWKVNDQWLFNHFSVSNGEFLSVRLFQLKRRPSNKPLDKYERRRSPPQFCVDRFSRQVSHRINWAVTFCRVSSNCLQGSFEIKNRRFFYHSECFILNKKCCSFARSDSVTCCFSQKKMSKKWGRWPGFLKIFIDCQFFFFWKLAVIVLLDNSTSNKMSLNHNFPFNPVRYRNQNLAIRCLVSHLACKTRWCQNTPLYVCLNFFHSKRFRWLLSLVWLWMINSGMIGIIF